MGSLEGKVALVSGSGRGIGREIALKLAQQGAQLVINDLDREPAEMVVAEIQARGGIAVACVGSLTEADFGERFVQAALDAFDGLDIIVNNTGDSWDSAIHKLSDDQWYAIVDSYLTAPFRILRAAHPVFSAFNKTETAAGQEVFRKVVNISSFVGSSGSAGHANSMAATTDISGITRMLAQEWGCMRVNVNTVSFGYIGSRLPETSAGLASYLNVGSREHRGYIDADMMKSMEKQVPLGRFGTPEEAAGAVYLLCMPESNYISGQTLLCSGGLSPG